MAKKMALGKGIASLIDSQASNPFLQAKSKMEMDAPIGSAEVKVEKKEDASPYMISVDQIKTNPNQPRKIFKEELLLELSNSIKDRFISKSLNKPRVDAFTFTKASTPATPKRSKANSTPFASIDI